MSAIKRDFLPDDLKSELSKNIVDGSVAVQADQSERETEFLLNLAQNNDIIRGVVGWIDLCDAHVEGRLEFYQYEKYLKGIRHVVQDEPDPEFMLRPDFQNGISLLDKYGLTYDILIFPKQFEAAISLAKSFPNQKFVLDHIAKPNIALGEIDDWSSNIQRLADCDNVYCKLSGMVTEAEWGAWKVQDFMPYMDVVMNSFGTNRVMFGSDWPVCLLSAKYDEMKSIVDYYLVELSEDEQDAVMGINATDFYSL